MRLVPDSTFRAGSQKKGNQFVTDCPRVGWFRVVYSLEVAPPSAPDLQEVQIPKPLALPMIAAQRPVMLANSPALKVAGVKAVSVVALVPATGVGCRVVPQAAIPGTIVGAADAALFWQAVVPVPARVESNFTVTDVGTTPVRVLDVRSATTPRLTV